MTVNVGIVGCANIAKKNVLAISMASGVKVTAVASRTRTKAEAWAKENVPNQVKCYEGYDTLLADEEIQAVYLPLPTSLHLEWVVKCAKAKKHILCEKPVAVTKDDLDVMLRACQDSKV